MERTIKVLILLFVFVFIGSAQDRVSMKSVLSPSADDLAEANTQGLEVFKILPRGMFDSSQSELSLRGGGAYYSFVKKSHSYDEIPQIELQKGDLLVGFYGVSYGLMADLGKTPLADVSRENKNTAFLFNYQPKKYEPEAREEKRKAKKGFQVEDLKYNKELPAVVGHTYLLRAISYREADTLVAFQIHRKEADGSLTIFWKLLENFEKPELIRNDQAALISAGYTETRAAKIEEQLRKKGFTNVKVSEEDKIIVLRRTVPKGKLADVILLVLEANEGKPVKNQLTED